MELHIEGKPLSALISEASKPKAQAVWDTLSTINVNEHVEKKNGFSYLSWAWAWGVLMENFPNSKFSFVEFDGGSEVFYFPDGTAEVRCVLTVDGISRVMWLPVMDHRNKAIVKPNARDINDTKMRCLVKAMALFGLGHYIYAGEDLPDTPKADTPKAEPVKMEPDTDPVEQLEAAITGAGTLDELKSAFTKATRFAKNRNDDALQKRFTTAKDKRKADLS
jgi:hypothetical protein